MKRGQPSDDDVTIHRDAAPASNGYDGEEMMTFIEAYEAEQREIDRIMDEAKAACQPHRQELPKILKQAAEAGFAKKQFAVHLKARALDYKRAHVADALDLEQRADYELMGEALAKHLGTFADTDLGRAAVGATQ